MTDDLNEDWEWLAGHWDAVAERVEDMIVQLAQRALNATDIEELRRLQGQAEAYRRMLGLPNTVLAETKERKNAR